MRRFKTWVPFPPRYFVSLAGDDNWGQVYCSEISLSGSHSAMYYSAFCKGQISGGLRVQEHKQIIVTLIAVIGLIIVVAQHSYFAPL